MKNHIIMLPFHPNYIELILKGKKKREYRKKFNENVKIIYPYATKPIQKIVGKLIINEIIKDKLKNIWNQEESGISFDVFQKYFENNIEGYSITFKELYIYQYPIDPFLIFNKFKPLQNYKFLTSSEASLIENSIPINLNKLKNACNPNTIQIFNDNFWKL